MHASVNVRCQDKSGPGKIHEVILVKYQKRIVSPHYCEGQGKSLPTWFTYQLNSCYGITI